LGWQSCKQQEKIIIKEWIKVIVQKTCKLVAATLTVIRNDV
jgi:hypothetical protein